MAKLRECLTKIDGFTKSAKDKLLAAFDRYKGQGMSDLQAGTEAIVDSYMDLNKDLNDLKTKASVPTKDGVRPEVKVEKKVAPEPKEVPKQTPKESMKAYSIEGLYQVNKRLFNLPNDQAKAAAIVMDKMIQTMAKRDGISPIEMYNRLKFEKATKEELENKKNAGEAAGAVMVAEDGKAIIYALTDPNVSTPLHELAHVFEHYLSDSERAAVQEWAGTKDWTTKTSEKFARGFEKYLATGEAPSTLKKIFDKFRQWLGEIYDGIIGSDIDITLNPQMEAIYAKMLGEGVVEKNVKKDAVKKEQEIPNTWFRGKYVEAQEGMTQDDLNNEILSDSENPAQIAEAYLSSENNQNTKSDVGSGTAEQKAYQFFKDGNKLSPKAFERVNDSNFANVKDTPGYRTYVAETGGLAEDGPNTKGYGDEITIDDVGNFLKNYPRGLGEYESKFGENMRSKLSGKFTRLTGKRLNPELAKRIVDEWNKFIEAQGLNEYFNPQEEMERESARFDAASKGILYQESSKKKKREQSPEEQKITALYEAIKAEPDLSKYKYEDLLDAYNYIITSQDVPQTKKGKIKTELEKRMGMNFFQRSMDKVKNDPEFSEEKAIKKDIGWFAKHLRVLSHFNSAFPELKGLSDLWQSAYFKKVKASKEKKRLNEKLAIEVIKERNKKMGIVQRVSEGIGQLFGNQNYKYFDYLDDGKGKLITVEQANKKGLSKAQIDYLKFVRELIGERKGLIGDAAYNTDMDVLKMDKKFYENFRTENGVIAASSLLGNTHNINNVRISFTNPNTGKDQITEYQNIENVLVKYGEKGIKERANALRLLAKYNMKARRQLRQQVNEDEKGQTNVLNVIRSGDYSLDENGKLKSKFDKPRDPKRAYSKDFYTATQEFIDDTEHIRYVSPLIPIINSIDYLNKNGVYEFDEDGNKIVKHGKKDNVSEWLKSWSDLHVIKRPNEMAPELDMALRFFRNWTSLSTMMFNAPAQLMNMAIGNYNNWRQENTKTWAKGQKRLFLDKPLERKITTDYAFGTVNPYAVDLARKYGAVSTDMDSNPIQSAGGVFAALGFLGTKWGEFQIQASGMLGKLSEEDYNSFEYKKNKFGVDELVIKDSVKDKEALEKRILDAIDSVSDIQGKYSDKDKRNIMNNELGKSVMQFKVWIPDWWRMRFGEGGSWSSQINGGFKKMREQIADKGFMKAMTEEKQTKEVMDFKRNLKGLMVTTMLLAFVYGDDDDDEKSLAALTAKRALSDLLFIFNPNTLKFTVTRPVASVGTIEKFIDASTTLFTFDEKDHKKGATRFDKLVKLTPANKPIQIAKDIEDLSK